MLEAIEKDEFDSLPPGSYRRNFLRQYAQALGLDEEETVAAFYQQYEEPSLPLPVPPKVTRRSHLREVAWVLAGIAGLRGLYKVAEKGHGSSEWKDTSVAGLRSEADRMQPATPAEPPSTAAPTPSTSKVHVGFTATEPVWVSVQCDGSLSFSGTLLGTETRTFDASRVITVLIGNVAGLAVSLNGRPIGLSGAHGEIQLLELTPAGARQLPHETGAPKSPDPVPHG